MKSETLKQRYEPKLTETEIEYERQLWQARYSPCGGFLIACGYDATVQRWNVSGEEIKKLPPLTGHHGWVQCMGFHPSQQRLLTADSWGQLTCWPYAEHKPQPLWTFADAHDGWIRALAVSPDGKHVATGGNDRVVRIRSTSDGKLHAELKHPATIFSLCYHPDGKSLVSGDLQGKLRHWETGSNKVVRTLDAGLLYRQHRIQECGGVRTLAFDAEGKKLACGGQKEPGGGFAKGSPCVLLFDWDSGKQIREMVVGGSTDGFAYDVVFHPADFLMSVACAFPKKGTLQFLNLDDGKAFYTGKNLTNGRTLSLHPDGRRLAMNVSQSPNGNGRRLKDGEYVGGSAKIRILQYPDPNAEQQNSEKKNS